MKVLFLFLLIAGPVYAQTTKTIEFHSDALNETRTIRLHLPKSFDSTQTQRYPLVLTLDGEYMFYTIMGTAQVLTMREIIPESVIVGIDQNYKVKDDYTARWFDCDYHYDSGKLKAKGIPFKTFIESELLPFLEKSYNIGAFRSIAGHSLSANYINYFLTDTTPAFSGFIAISPYIPGSMEKIIRKTIKSAETETYYFVSTGEHDLSGHIPQILEQDTTLFGQSNNTRFHYLLKNYPDETHMSLPVRSASDALCHMFAGYSPLYTLGNDSLLMLEPDLVDYLNNRYSLMRKTYGTDVKMREDDLLSVSWIAEQKADWDELDRIGRLTVQNFPLSVYGYYMLGLAEEKRGNYAKALEAFRKGYDNLGDDVTNKSDFYADIERVEKLLTDEQTE